MATCRFAILPFFFIDFNKRHAMRRKRFKKDRICSSDNYLISRELHKEYLQQCHEHFRQLEISGEIKFDIPAKKENGKPNSGFVTVRIWGNLMKMTVEQHRIHCASYPIVD